MVLWPQVHTGGRAGTGGDRGSPVLPRNHRVVVDLDEHMRRGFGGGRGAPPVATIRRVVLGMDPDLVDAGLTASVTGFSDL